MSKFIYISGYTHECNCDHCGRSLTHGINLSDGRIVGAQCLNSKLTMPKKNSNGKFFRYGPSFIIKVAKCVQFVSCEKWINYGVNDESTRFFAS